MPNISTTQHRAQKLKEFTNNIYCSVTTSPPAKSRHPPHTDGWNMNIQKRYASADCGVMSMCCHVPPFVLFFFSLQFHFHSDKSDPWIMDSKVHVGFDWVTYSLFRWDIPATYRFSLSIFSSWKGGSTTNSAIFRWHLHSPLTFSTCAIVDRTLSSSHKRQNAKATNIDNWVVGITWILVECPHRWAHKISTFAMYMPVAMQVASA